jgi:hypothetical protein
MTASKPRRRAPQTPYAHIEVTHDGKTMTLRDWSDEVGIPYQTFLIRYKRGARDEALFKDVRAQEKPVEYQGETLTLSEWGRKLGIPAMTLIRRRLRGDEGERLFRPLGDTLYARRQHMMMQELRDKEARLKALADALPPTFGKLTE